MGASLDTLETYLASDYLAQKQEIAALDEGLLKVAGTFSSVFSGGEWPYHYRLKTKVTKNDFSQGTTAMVLTAAGRILGHCSLPKKSFEGVKVEEDLESKLEKAWSTALKRLIADLRKKKGIVSTSFGADNPLTLSHISELQALLKKSSFAAEKRNLARGLAKAKKKLKKVLENGVATSQLLKPDSSIEYQANAFIPLRTLRAASDLNIDDAKASDSRRFFETALHEHLSFSSIPDSRFDPADLIFCVEGLLICAREAVDKSLFNRVLEVLGEKQNTSAYWRPNKPILASSQGAIFLPISVEGANSLMRSILKMDETRKYETFTAKALPLLLRFWHWLRARSVQFKIGDVECIGWHSEHVNDPDLIHIWDTSQVTEFMISLREMLERHIATQTLRLSRLDVKRSPSKETWKEITKKFEPMPRGKRGWRVYEGIGKSFVNPELSGNPENFSMLLYGPPGTGKSTIAENLAQVLGRPLITVTVSDFLGAGGANVEARAKAIFQTLEAQEGCVILFDEIDSFLLNRDSRLYRKQDSLFQFLTPGMLTKINDLRKAKRSIFIIATNYANRIDPAIKRTGRIDKQYLVPLPDADRRIEILKAKDLKSPTKAADLKALRLQTVFFGYTDLIGVTKEAGGKNATLAKLIRALPSAKPATSLSAYIERGPVEEKFPFEEFETLVHLANEVKEVKSIDKANKLINEEKNHNESWRDSETKGRVKRLLGKKVK